MSLLGLVSYGSDSDSENETKVSREDETSEKESKTGQLPLPQAVESTNSKGTYSCSYDRHDYDTRHSVKLDSVTMERIKHYCELKATSGFDFTENIRGKKEFGNPHILQKVVDYYHIDQVMTALFIILLLCNLMDREDLIIQRSFGIRRTCVRYAPSPASLYALITM